MSEVSERELLRRLETLDEETLHLISTYALARRRLVRVSTIVSALIASIGGLALVASFFFPGSSPKLVGIGSIVLGAIIAGLGIWERKREEFRLISQLLSESRYSAPATLGAERKRQLIEQFLKAEGLG